MLPPGGECSTTSGVLMEPMVFDEEFSKGSTMLHDFSWRLRFGLGPVADLMFARHRASVWKSRLKNRPFIAPAPFRPKAQLTSCCRTPQKDLVSNPRLVRREFDSVACLLPCKKGDTFDIFGSGFDAVKESLMVTPFAAPAYGKSGRSMATAAARESGPLGWGCSSSSSDTVSPFGDEMCSKESVRHKIQQCGSSQIVVHDVPHQVPQQSTCLVLLRGDFQYDVQEEDVVLDDFPSKFCGYSSFPKLRSKREWSTTQNLGTNEEVHKRMLELELECEKRKLESLAAFESAESLRARVNQLLCENRYLRMAYTRRHPVKIQSGYAAENSDANSEYYLMDGVKYHVCHTAVSGAPHSKEASGIPSEKDAPPARYHATTEYSADAVEGLERKIALYRRELLLLSEQNDALRGRSATESSS